MEKWRNVLANMRFEVLGCAEEGQKEEMGRSELNGAELGGYMRPHLMRKCFPLVSKLGTIGEHDQAPFYSQPGMGSLLV